MKEYGKKLLGMLLCAALALGLAPRGLSTAKAENYDLYIGGVRVTSDNLEGTGWKFRPGSGSGPNTLELNGFSYQGSGALSASTAIYHAGILYNEAHPLIIEMQGNSSININVEGSSGALCSICSPNAAITIQGDGRLTCSQGDSGNNDNIAILAQAITFCNGTVNANGGDTNIGRSCGIYGEVTVEGGTVYAKGGSSNGFSYGIFGGSVTVDRGYLEATGGTANEDSVGIMTGRINETVTVDGGTVYAKGGSSNASSYGLYVGSVTVGHGYLEATGGTAGSLSCGIVARDFNGTVTVTGGKMRAEGDRDSGTSYGIKANNGTGTVTIGKNAWMYASGSSQAIVSQVRNEIAGEGQAELNGSVWTVIEAKPNGQTVDLKSAVFPIEYFVWIDDAEVTSANLSGDGWSFTPKTDSAPDTLSLDGFSYSGLGYAYYHNSLTNRVGIAYSGGGPLVINLTNTNQITVTGDGSADLRGIMTGRDISIQGSGKLTIQTGNSGPHDNNGIEARNVDIIGGELTVTAGTATGGALSYGIDSSRTTIHENAKVTVSGNDQAIDGTLWNEMAGLGWEDTAGTSGETEIAVHTSGGISYSYKKLLFPAPPLAAISRTPTANERIHNGEEAPLLNSDGEAEGGTLVYAAGDSTAAPDSGWDTEIPARTETGKYYVWVKAAGDSTHRDSAAVCVPSRICFPVTFKVTGGTWADGTTEKTLDVSRFDPGELRLTLKAEDIPAGSPDEAHKDPGTWDEDPGEYAASGSVLTAAKTFTYAYPEKEKTSATVIFKVANGNWNDDTDTDITVTLQGYEGDPLKLAETDIPAVGSRPAEGYKAGSWDTAPSTETEFTANTTTTYTYTYEEKTQTDMTVSAENVRVVYDGQPHGITVTVTDPAEGAAVKYGTSEGACDLDASPAITDAGTLTVYYRVSAENYTDYTGSATVTVEKADPAVTAPTAKTGLVYTGSAQELVEAGTVAGGEMQYALGADESTTPASGWSTAVPAATEAGTWYVWYKVVGDANHKDTDPACVTVTIAAPKPSGKMRPVLKSDGKKALQLSFTQMNNVDGYDVYLAPNSSKHFKLKKTLSADKASCKLSGLKMYTPYKVYIEAWVTENGGKKVVSTSETVYSYTSSGDGAETNLKSIKVKKSMTVTVDDTQKLSPKAVGEVEGQKVATRFGGFRYESSNPEVATVSGRGKVTGVKAGSCTVTITGFNGVTKNVTVNVKPKAQSISFPETSYKVKVGKKLKLGKELVVTPSDARVTLTWKSSKTSVATVDKNGVVTGVSKGTTTITVKTSTGLKVKVKVKVK